MSEPEKSQNRQSSHADDMHCGNLKQRLEAGDDSVWKDLDAKYKKAIMSKLFLTDRERAEDAWQEALKKLAQDPSCFPEEKKDSRVQGWLYKVAHNKLIDLLRKEKRLPVTRGLDLNSYADKQSSQETRSENAQQVHLTVMKLDKKYRIVIQRHYFEGETLADIAQDIGISPEAIRSRHFRAKAQLSQMLDGGDND